MSLKKTNPEAYAKIQEAKKNNSTELNLSYLALAEVPEEIYSLEQLESLNLRNNNLIIIPDELSKLSRLTRVILYENPLEYVPNVQGLYLDFECYLNIRSNIIAENITGTVVWRKESVQELDILAELTSLELLFFDDIMLTEFPESIFKLEKLIRLYIYNNKLSHIPDSFNNLKNLLTIDFSDNNISKLPKSLVNLPKLEQLNLVENPLESPPLEVAEKGIDAIRDYFRQLEEEGTDYSYEAKLLIVGEPDAGKTSLAKKIENPNYVLKSKEKSTKGIEIIKWSFKDQNNNKIDVNIWDFGGQQIYHETHQFFLTENSLYILLVDNRKEDTDFYYWLNTIEMISNNSPILIVQNEKQKRKKDLNEKDLIGQYKTIKEFNSTNLANNEGLDNIIRNIEFYVSKLSHIGKPFPRTWKKVREKLELDKRDYISIEEFNDICVSNGFKNEKDQLQLSAYLHDIGVCLHFQKDKILKRLVILNPTWGTDAVYRVLDDEDIIEKQGRFSIKDLNKLWSEEKYNGKIPELLALMEKFKLCYEIPSSKENYIAPLLLTKSESDYEWDEKDNLEIKYDFEFMPKGIITRFIVEMHKFIKEEIVWKSGVLIEKNNAIAEVIEKWDHRVITVRISGKIKKELMTIIIYVLENIISSYHKLEYSMLIPCTCEECKESEESYFHDYDEIIKLRFKSPVAQCVKSGEMVDILELIGNVVCEEDINISDKNKIGRQTSLQNYISTDKLFLQQTLDGDVEMNKKNINIGDGAHIEGSVVISDSINDSFNVIKKSSMSDDHKKTLEDLLNAITELGKNAPEKNTKDVEQIAEDANTLSTELAKESPRQNRVDMYLEDIKTTAVKIGAAATPIIGLIELIGKFF